MTPAIGRKRSVRFNISRYDGEPYKESAAGVPTALLKTLMDFSGAYFSSRQPWKFGLFRSANGTAIVVPVP